MPEQQFAGGHARSSVVFISSGAMNDGGGFEIVEGSDGKLHVKFVHPWDGPFAATILNTIVSVSNLARVTDKPGLRSQLEAVAETITNSYSVELAHWAQNAPGQKAGEAAGGL